MAVCLSPLHPSLGSCWRGGKDDSQDQSRSNKQMSRKVCRGRQKGTNRREDGLKAKGRRGVSTPRTEGGHCRFTTSHADLRVSVLRVM